MLGLVPAAVAVACGGAIEKGDRPGSRPEASSGESAEDPTTLSDALPRDAGRLDGPRDAAVDAPIDEISPLPDGSLADGVCAHPTGHEDLFDPDCVYVLGTFVEGASGNSALFEPAHPADPRGGIWDYGMAHALVRPADNRVVYGSAGMRVFVADPRVGGRYPSDLAAAANDPPLATPACPNASNLEGIFPDDSVAIYRCGFGPRYLEGTSVPIAGLENGFDALGPMRTALVLRPTNGPKIWIDGVDVPITGLPGVGGLLTARYGGGHRFLCAFTVGATPVVLQQWSIGFDGVATYVGDYLNPQNILTGFGSALDPAGNLYRVSWEGFDDRIVRMSLVAPPVVVYDEQYPDGGKKPLRLHGATLFTGP
jgi:hypothetical protein